MGLDLPVEVISRTDFTLGKDKTRKSVSATSVYFESLLSVDTKTGLIDYDELEKNTALFKPALIICGGSAYAKNGIMKD